MIKQIFVVGRNRSGTKWLSNLIANSPNVAAVQSDVDGGIIETNLFVNYPKYFKLSNRESKTAFQILFKHSNFYKCANSEGFVVEKGNYDTYYGFFKQFMDFYAKIKNCDYWLQKGSSNELGDLMQEFPSAKYIIIQRDNISAHILSYIVKDKQKVLLRDILFHVFGYWRYRKNENAFQNLGNVKIVKYEDLKKDASSVLQEVCSYLGIGYKDEMLTTSFKRNTSYRKGKKKDYLTKKNITKIKIISSLVCLMPLFVLNMLSALFQRFYEKEVFVPGTFSLHRNMIK